MARPAEPPRSVRLGSQVAKTVKTSSNVIRSSTRRPCPTERLEFTLETDDKTNLTKKTYHTHTGKNEQILTVVTPKDPLTAAGVTR